MVRVHTLFQYTIRSWSFTLQIYFFYFTFCAQQANQHGLLVVASLLCAVSFVLFSFCLAGAQLVSTVNDA